MSNFDKSNHTIFMLTKAGTVVARTMQTQNQHVRPYRHKMELEFNELNQNWNQKFPKVPLNEISTLSTDKELQKASAFNLQYEHDGKFYPVENVFQAAKTYQGESDNDYVLKSDISPLEAKSRAQAKNKKMKAEKRKLTGFNLFGQKFPNQPRTFFYNWLYCKAMNQPHNANLKKKIQPEVAFSDAYFNIDQKNFRENSQAQACGLIGMLWRQKKLDAALKSPEDFKKIVYDGGMLKDNTITSLSEQQPTLNEQAIPNKAVKKETTDSQTKTKKAETTETNLHHSQTINPITDKSKLILSLSQLPNINNKELQNATKNLTNDTKSDFETIKKLNIPSLQKLINSQKLNDTTWNQTQVKTNQMVQTAQQKNINIINFTEPDYPNNLKNISNQDFPNLIYVQGNTKLLNQRPSINIRGDQHIDGFGEHMAPTVTNQFNEDNYNIVSNLDTKTNNLVNYEALKNNNAPIIVLNQGLDQPKTLTSNQKKGIQAVIQNGGAVISEYHIGEQPNQYATSFIKDGKNINLERPDRLSSGISNGLFTIQGTKKSKLINNNETAINQGLPIATINPTPYLNNLEVKSRMQINPQTNELNQILIKNYHAMPTSSKNDFKYFKNFLKNDFQKKQSKTNEKENSFEK